MAIPVQRLVHPVSQPEQRDLPKGRQVAGAEVVGQGRVHLVGGVHVPVRHPPPQRLGRHVDQLDLLGRPDHIIRNGLALFHLCDGLDHVVE